MRVVGPFNCGAAAGGAGVATANATTTSPINGLLLAIYLKYQDSPPAATTDVTVATSGTAHPAVTLLSITNAATDAWFYSQVNICNTSGTAQTSNWMPIPICDTVKVTIAGANNGDYVDVYLLVE